DALTVGLAGNVPADATAHLERRFSVLPSHPSPPAPTTRREGEASSRSNRMSIEIIEKPAAGTPIVIGRRLDLDHSSVDYAAVLLANVWLGDGFTGRLFQRIRNERGLSYGAYSGLLPDLSGRFAVHLQPVDPQNAPMALRIALDELRR